MVRKKTFYENINGKQVFCVFSDSLKVNGSKNIVIMSHGFRGSSVGPARTFVDFEKMLLKNGFSVFRFDQPNSGNSEGDYIDTSYYDWVDTIVYFAKKYAGLGYRVVLLGQSMGGAATVIATSKKELKDKIPCILLWVPGVNDGGFNGEPDEIFEEGGQKYKGKFWLEAQESDFYSCLNGYGGGIHLVYGEYDKYIKQELRDKVIKLVKEKGQSTMVLKGQDHSPWEFDLAQKVYEEELKFLNKYLLKVRQ